MSFTPLLDTSPIVQIHAISAILALGLGPFIFFFKKGNHIHKFFGRIWALAMVGTIFSSYFIFGIRLWGPFSPIHLLSLYATYTLIMGVHYARVGKIRQHKQAMSGLYFGGLIVAGTFTLMPGRIMNRVVFGEPSEIGFYAVVASVLIGFSLFKMRKTFGQNILRMKLGGSISQKI